jgi:hypothetical protein
MARAIPSNRRFLSGLLLLACASVLAASPDTQPAPWQSQPPGQRNFAPPDYRLAAADSQRRQPVYGAWPGQQAPGYDRQTYYQSALQAPRMESELSRQDPYVRQGVVLKLSLISQYNLLTAVPDIGESDQLTLQLLEGPTTYSRSRKGRQEIVSDYYYELIPLRAGKLSLPAIRFSGEHQLSGYSRSSRRFEAALSQPPQLRVRKADPATAPWLPLEQLELQVALPGSQQATAGKPLALTVELVATGLGGNQLPSLETQLKSDAFRVYREQSRVETGLDRKKQRIIGRRVERFTLVPQYGGDLSLPPLSVNWWNTRSDSPQRSSLPMRSIAVSGTAQASGLFAGAGEIGPFLSGNTSAFWLPLAVVFGVIFGYWLAVWIAHRRRRESGSSSPLQPLVAFLQRPMQEMAPAFSPLAERLRATGNILNPVKRWHRWRRRLVAGLPLSVRFHYCVRFVDEEQDPETWGFTLRFLANKHMGLPPNAPFSVIGKHILDFHPKADPQRIRELIHQLEASVYGHSELDFERWKAAFKHEIRPSLRLWPAAARGKRAQPRARLPGLNPGRATGG